MMKLFEGAYDEYEDSLYNADAEDMMNYIEDVCHKLRRDYDRQMSIQSEISPGLHGEIYKVYEALKNMFDRYF